MTTENGGEIKNAPFKLTDNIFVWLHETGEIYELTENINSIE